MAAALCKSIEAFGQDPKGLDGEATKATVPEGHAPNTVANTVTVDLEKRLEALLAAMAEGSMESRQEAYLSLKVEMIIAIPLLLTQLREYRTALEARPAMPEREAIARALASFDYNSSVPEYNRAAIDRLWPNYLRKADAILALPTTGDVREAAPERDADREALNGYRAAVAWISSDSWDGCSDCIAILHAARNADVSHPGWSNDDLARELARIRKHSGHFGNAHPAALASPPSAHDMREAVRQHVMEGDPEGLRGIALQWYLGFDFGYPHSVRESNIAVEAFKDGYRATLSSSPMDAVKAAVEAERALAWLAENKRCELFFNGPVYADDSEPEEWRVSRHNGSINDREWEIVGRGKTPLAAINEASAALRARAGGAK